MSSKNYLFLCGNVRRHEPSGYDVHHFELGKDKRMIHMDIEAISRKMVQKIPDVMKDLLEIATYVYCADQKIPRGGPAEFEYGQKWNRELTLEIPVREYERWSQSSITERLEETLSFVSGDTYHFVFKQQGIMGEPDFMTYGEKEDESFKPDEIALFSGGLDSFTGAIDAIIGNNRKTVLVSHVSNGKIQSLQKALHEYISKKTLSGAKPLHVQVKINKDKRLTNETSQRSRSFLFASLGTVIAHMFGLDRVNFYENGIVSCNLPFDTQTHQARRTRSTHPRFLCNFSSLISELLERDFHLGNPYFGMTKTDVVERLKALHHEPHIKLTRSCAGSIFEYPCNHCGTCSQCIDRRFATLAAKCENYDSESIYKVGLFTGSRERVQDRAMAAGFAGLATNIESMTPDNFVRQFTTDLTELAKFMGKNREEAMLDIFNLYQRHARQVNTVIDEEIERRSASIRKGLVPEHSLLSMILQNSHLNPALLFEDEQAKPKIKKKPGRPKDPNTAKRDQRMLDAWETRRYRTFGELAREFGLPSADAARKAVDRAKAKRDRKIEI